MEDAASPLRIRVQVVLYRNKAAEVWRLLSGLVATLRRARLQIAVDADLALGDCSPVPALSPSDIEELRAEGTTGGFREVLYRFFDQNLGSAGGSNELAKGTSNDFLLVLNPDTYPAPEMLVELIAAMEDPQVAIAEARQIPVEHPKDYDKLNGDTVWASGCCMLVRRWVFDQLEGFDAAHFPLYCDDVDLSWRTRLLGYRVVHVPKAVVFHQKRIDLSGRLRPAPTEVFHATLARLMLARKYGAVDVFDETVSSVEQGGGEDHRRALAEFRSRQELGRVPAAIANGERVAHFEAGEYAHHRF